MEKGTKESWKTDGNCDECRRNTYCSKPCKANKLADQAAFYNAFHTAFSKTKAGKALDLIQTQLNAELKERGEI